MLKEAGLGILHPAQEIPALSQLAEEKRTKLTFDWRFQAVAITASEVPAAYPGGPSHPAGSALAMTSLVQSTEGIRFAFITPSASALALSVAANAIRAASRIKNDLQFSNSVAPGGDQHVFVSPPGAVCDYFENCFVALLFSIQALEAYCNYKIAYTLRGDFTVEIRGEPAVLSPIEVERKLSIDDKLGEVLPKLLNIPTPKGQTVWKNYINPRRLRDATVHIKSLHQWTSSPEDFQESPYAWCFHQPPSSILLPAIEMIKYFAVNHELEWLEGAKKAMNPDQVTTG